MSAVRITSRHAGSHVRLTLDRPRGNILSLDMIHALERVLAGLPRDGGIKLLTIAGAGSDFSFGARVEEHTGDKIVEVLPELHRLLGLLLDAPAPTAAIVRGRCLGGGFELALACDFIFAADDATLGLPEIGLGVFPPAGAILLPARIGASRAAQAVLEGQALSAAWWHEVGLLHAVVPAETLDETVEGWFSRSFLPRSAVALRHAAWATRATLKHAVGTALPQVERLYLDSLMRSHDATEGICAFLERRPPAWRNA